MSLFSAILKEQACGFNSHEYLKLLSTCAWPEIDTSTRSWQLMKTPTFLHFLYYIVLQIFFKRIRVDMDFNRRYNEINILNLNWSIYDKTRDYFYTVLLIAQLFPLFCVKLETYHNVLITKKNRRNIHSIFQLFHVLVKCCYFHWK